MPSDGSWPGAIAMIALMVFLFYPTTDIDRICGCFGGQCRIVPFETNAAEQGIALLVAIAAPTIAMVLAVRTVNYQQQRQPDASAGRRLKQTLVLYVRTSILMDSCNSINDSVRLPPHGDFRI